MPMNPEQVHLLVHVAMEGSPSMTMREHIHAAILLWRFHQMSFYTYAKWRDWTMCCVLDIDIVSFENQLPQRETDTGFLYLPLHMHLSCLDVLTITLGVQYLVKFQSNSTSRSTIVCSTYYTIATPDPKILCLRLLLTVQGILAEAQCSATFWPACWHQ